VTSSSLSKILDINNENTIYKIIERLEKNKLINRLIKGKYTVSNVNLSDFEKANLILSPSYISLESALTYYGVLPQFTYSITSVTTQKSKRFEIGGKEYEYTKISRNFYSDFVKKDNFLIATPEKALIDLIYLASKKLRKIELTDLDMSIIDWDAFNKLRVQINYIPFQNYLERNNI
jgi:predicted transcriptional regulator of viral defense system